MKLTFIATFYIFLLQLCVDFLVPFNTNRNGIASISIELPHCGSASHLSHTRADPQPDHKPFVSATPSA